MALVAKVKFATRRLSHKRLEPANDSVMLNARSQIGSRWRIQAAMRNLGGGGAMCVLLGCSFTGGGYGYGYGMVMGAWWICYGDGGDDGRERFCVCYLRFFPL